MRKTNGSLIIVLLFFVQSVYGQNIDSLHIPKSEITVSYLGSIKYPGLRLGAELPLQIKQVVNSSKTKTILKVRSLTFNLAYYHQKDFHDNLYFTAEWQMRRIGVKGWFREFTPGIGYSRTFLGGTTYKINDNGEVSVKRFAGFNYAILTLAGGYGYDFSRQRKLPFKVFTKLSVIAMFPYNSFIYVRPTAEVGLIYTPKSFLKTNPFIKVKHK